MHALSILPQSLNGHHSAPPRYRMMELLEFPDMQVPSAGKELQVLALLMTRAGRPVPMALLAEELWGEEWPLSWETTIHTYISKLRKAAGDQESKTLFATTQGACYVLNIDPDEIDVNQIESAYQRATMLASEQQLAAALSVLSSGLTLARGPVLVCVKSGQVLSAWIARVKERLRTSLCLKFELSLRLGRHLEILPELRAAWQESKTWECFTRYLMIALYRSGLRADITDVWLQMRKALQDELGLDPSPQLDRLFRSILNGDKSLLDNPELPH